MMSSRLENRLKSRRVVRKLNMMDIAAIYAAKTLSFPVITGNRKYANQIAELEAMGNPITIGQITFIWKLIYDYRHQLYRRPDGEELIQHAIQVLDIPDAHLTTLIESLDHPEESPQ